MVGESEFLGREAGVEDDIRIIGEPHGEITNPLAYVITLTA
jgi:hypothetical protein